MQTAYQFFREHGSYLWSETAGESEDEGRKRCAYASAAAELAALNAGCSFSWEGDPDLVCTSADWIDPLHTWLCIMRDGSGAIVGSMGGVDFGRDGQPWGQPYRRVVEADLASEWLAKRPEFANA